MAAIVRRKSGSVLPDLVGWFDANFPQPSNWPFAPMLHALRVEDYVEDGTYTLRIELPGVDPEEDVEINVGNGTLTVVAERSEESRDRSHSEFRYGRFARTVSLPSGAVEDKIDAQYQDGILTITVPLADSEERSRRVPVRRSRHVAATE